MSKNEWKKSVSVVGRMVLAYALVFAQGAWAGQNQGTKDKSTSPQKAAVQQANEKQSAAATTAKEQSKQTQVEESESAVAEEKRSHDGSHEGIKVHGHWTIEVRNPDGTLVTHREFENSLQPSGGALLANIIAGTTFSAGQTQGAVWAVDCLGTVNGGRGIELLDTRGTLTPPQGPAFGQYQTLTVTVDSFGELVLSGTGLTSLGSGQLFSVATYLNDCIFSVCRFGFSTSNIVTSTTLSSPISVFAGQTVAVTVAISFS